jgi:hypothetical protein
MVEIAAATPVGADSAARVSASRGRRVALIVTAGATLDAGDAQAMSAPKIVEHITSRTNVFIAPPCGLENRTPISHNPKQRGFPLRMLSLLLPM